MKTKLTMVYMKRKEMIRRITPNGYELVRYGGRHDFYENYKTGKKQSVPTHDEIDENIAKML